MSKRSIKISLVLFFILSPFVISFIQAAGMGPPVPCGGPFPPCPIPLDGGVTLLLIAGAAYGGKKIYHFTIKNPE